MKLLFTIAPPAGCFGTVPPGDPGLSLYRDDELASSWQKAYTWQLFPAAASSQNEK
jgi:hypothetical protein